MKLAAVISKSLYLSKIWFKVILLKQSYLKPLKKITPHQNQQLKNKITFQRNQVVIP